MTQVLAALALLMALAGPGLAQEPTGEPEQGVWLPSKEFADLIGKGIELAAAKKQVQLLEQELEIKTRIINGQKDLLALEEAKARKHQERALIEADDAQFWKGRLAAAQKDANKKIRWAHIQATAAAGALLCSPLFPPFGSLACGGGGALLGLFTAPTVELAPPEPAAEMSVESRPEPARERGEP